MNKYVNIYHVPYFIYPSTQLSSARTNVIGGNVLLEKDLVNLQETRVRPISGVDHGTVDPIVLYEVC